MADWLKYIPFVNTGKNTPRVAVIRLHGPIGIPMALGRSLNLSNQAAHIEAAFEMRNIKAVALLINSPGGSPVQSMLIHNRIRQLAKEKGVPVFAFAEDVAASGGYILALAGDEIYSDPSSILGSIGVISAGFGFHKAIEKIGVERRVYTAGDSKALLDAFQPEDPDDVARLKGIQAEMHQTFIALVKERRADNLKEQKEDLFSGAFWTGTQAKELGLIDGLGDIRSIMQRRFGANVKLKLVGAKERWWSPREPHVVSVRGLSWPDLAAPAMSITEDLLASIEVRALWSRFGL